MNSSYQSIVFKPKFYKKSGEYKDKKKKIDRIRQNILVAASQKTLVNKLSLIYGERYQGVLTIHDHIPKLKFMENHKRDFGIAEKLKFIFINKTNCNLINTDLQVLTQFLKNNDDKLIYISSNIFDLYKYSPIYQILEYKIFDNYVPFVKLNIPLYQQYIINYKIKINDIFLRLIFCIILYVCSNISKSQRGTDNESVSANERGDSSYTRSYGGYYSEPFDITHNRISNRMANVTNPVNIDTLDINSRNYDEVSEASENSNVLNSTRRFIIRNLVPNQPVIEEESVSMPIFRIPMVDERQPPDEPIFNTPILSSNPIENPIEDDIIDRTNSLENDTIDIISGESYTAATNITLASDITLEKLTIIRDALVTIIGKITLNKVTISNNSILKISGGGSLVVI